MPLGTHALYWGKVRRGHGRGGPLGFPTANLHLHRPARDGIYIGETRVGRRWHPSAVFIGAALTFGQSDRRLETTLLDYSGSLYGQWVTVRLLKRIRGNREFPNVIALKSAMADDLKKVREFFSSSPTA